MKTFIALIIYTLSICSATADNVIPNAYLMDEGAFSATLFTYQVGLSNSLNFSNFNDVQPSPNTRSGKAKTRFVNRNNFTKVITKLSKPYPANQRKSAQKFYKELIKRYRLVEKRLGLPAKDVASGIAAAIAGSYMAFADVEVSDAGYVQLVNQIRGVLSETPAIQKIRENKKQELYVDTAIIGMMMLTVKSSLQSQPNESTNQLLKQAARNVLETFLQIEAERIVISDNGLEVF